MNFEVGDRVLVKEFRPEYRDQAPTFTTQMERFCGQESTIEDISGKFYFFNGYWWHADWLDHVEEEAENDIDPAAFDAIIHPFVKA